MYENQTVITEDFLASVDNDGREDIGRSIRSSRIEKSIPESNNNPCNNETLFAEVTDRICLNSGDSNSPLINVRTRFLLDQKKLRL